MPNVSKTKLVNELTGHVRDALTAADRNQDGEVSKAERNRLPSDVRGLADRTADYYLGGGPLPIGAYVQAYRNYARKVTDSIDTNGDGVVQDTQLPGTLYRSVTAMRANATNTSTPSTPTSSTTNLNTLYAQLGQGGWTDDDLTQFLAAARAQGQLGAQANRIRQAVANPQLPTEDHSGDRFFEAMAWYTDMTQSPNPNGQLSLYELQVAIQKAANKYLNLALQQPQETNARLQTWKNIQKLRLLEGQIKDRAQQGLPASYPYKPQAMMAIDPTAPFNVSNTIDTPAEFQQRVIEASYDKPVLVKYGLTYCMHCLLLEQLGSVPAVAEKYGDSLDVYKLWWNPKDPGMKAISDVAKAEGVTSSPYFIVYDQGQAVRAGYAFPDENGDGVEELVKGIVPTPNNS